MTTDTEDAKQGEILTLDQIRSTEGLRAFLRLLGTDVPAVEAKFDDRHGCYIMTALADRDYQQLRRTHLVAALFSSFRIDREAISYRSTVGEFASQRKTLIIISTGDDGMRVYHYHS